MHSYKVGCISLLLQHLWQKWKDCCKAGWTIRAENYFSHCEIEIHMLTNANNFFSGLPNIPPLHASAMRVQPGEKSCSGGRASRLGVVPATTIILAMVVHPGIETNLEQFVRPMSSRVQNDAPLGQLLQGRSVHVRVVPGHIVEAKVVSEQHQKIWRPCHMVDYKKQEQHGF